MKLIYVISIFALSLCSCKNENVEVKSEEKVNTEAPATDQPALTTLSLPTLDAEIFKKIAQSCDYVDYIFYNLPISISQDNRQAILSNINFISREPITSYPATCKSMGRKSFMSDGEILLEADVYLNKEQGCYFYVFLKDGKPAYANKIANDGINFYFNVFSQAGVK